MKHTYFIIGLFIVGFFFGGFLHQHDYFVVTFWDWFGKTISHPVFITILSGSLVYLLGQALVMFILQPFQEYKKIKGDISFRLKFYTNVYSTTHVTEEMEKEVREKLRRAACDLERIYETIPAKWFFKIPNEQQIALASTRLIGLSNGVGMMEQTRLNAKAADEIRQLLGIRDYQAIPH